MESSILAIFCGLSANFGESGGWAAGDFDCSGDVVFSDFLLLSGNFGAEAAQTAAVPEPSTLSYFFLALGIQGFVMRRRQRNTVKPHGRIRQQSSTKCCIPIRRKSLLT